MRTTRMLLAVLLAAILTLSAAAPVYAEETAEAQELLQQMLCYYHHHQSAGKTDVYRLLAQMETVDPDKASLWRDIFEYWFYANDEMDRNVTQLPEDLPKDDSLCIVVLGYRLGAWGNMDRELVGRLELTLQAANQYPEALVVCTGGGTASEAPNVTEAGQMVQWLRKQGIDSNRIIRENRSTHTIENAKYVFDILASRYPQVTHLVIVTSDYHLPRSTTLFYAKARHTALANGTEAVKIAAVLGYDADHEGIAEDPLDQTAHLARVSGFEYRRGEEPPLSGLTNLKISGSDLLEMGQMPDVTVTAEYDTGFSRDVTADCALSGYDPENGRTQTLTATYEENGVQITVSFEIRRPEPETVPTEAPATEAPTGPVPMPQEAQPVRSFPYPILGAALGVLLLILLLKKRK